MPTLTPTATVTPDPDYGWRVSVRWTANGPERLDRTDGHGYAVRTRALADRLARAIDAGVVFYDLGIAVDVNGQTYVSSRSHVLGRYANADLRKLGF